MTAKLYAVYGVGGCGRGLMPVAREQLSRLGEDISRLVFVDDHADVPVLNGHRVLSYEAFLAEKADERWALLAVAQSKHREALALKCRQAGVKAWSVAASGVVIMDDVTLGEGSALSPFVTLMSNIKIGSYFHANLYSYVEHDCVIGDFVTFAPGVHCNGNVVIEDHAYIGAGAILKQGQRGRPLTIGRGAVVGMGAVVTKDVPAGAVVAGNPARSLKGGMDDV